MIASASPSPDWSVKRRLKFVAWVCEVASGLIAGVSELLDGFQTRGSLVFRLAMIRYYIGRCSVLALLYLSPPKSVA